MQENALTGIDPASWQATILPLPKRFGRGGAYGFCGGHPVGRAEAARERVAGVWWPDGKPELLTIDGQQVVTTGHASGDVIPGQWISKTGDAMGAVAWTLKDGRLAGSELHDQAYARSWASSAGPGTVIGGGWPAATSGQRSPNVGLVWRDGSAPAAVAAASDVVLMATDGTRLAGSIRGRATLWSSATAEPIDLTPDKIAMAEVQALDGGLQVGIAFKGFRARAGIWRGNAASFADITPKGFQTARAVDGTHGYQVGFVRQKDTTKDGSGGADNRAVLWQGAADRWVDLNALLPAETYNASTAWAIEVRGDVLQVCGCVNRYELYHAGTRESHAVPVEHPVLWTARLA